MLNVFFSSPPAFIILATALLIAITVHEFAHAYLADYLGDPTPRLQGRVTLNPLAHLDPLGTILLLIFGFGWGKPVMFDPYNLKNVQRDTVLIALAGPASNVILAFIIAVLLPWLPFSFAIWQAVIHINIILAAFNLIPIYPLDGSKILQGLLPKHLAIEYQEVMSRYGSLILLAMIFFPFRGKTPIDYLIPPMITGLRQGIFWLASILTSPLM